MIITTLLANEITDSYTNGVYTQLNGIVHEIEEFA